MVKGSTEGGAYGVVPLPPVPDFSEDTKRQDPKRVLVGILGDEFSELEMVASMGDDVTVVNAARVSWGKRKNTLSDRDAALIHYLAENAHTSPFRHVSLQFRVKAPEFVARQWYKHVVGADYAFKDTGWNEISQRYVEVPNEFYIPKTWRTQKGKQTSGDSIVFPSYTTEVYKEQLTESVKVYKEMLAMGVSREQARMVLPLSVYTEWYWTASLQAVAHFINLRQEVNAQWEIQQYAEAMHTLASQVAVQALAALLNSMKRGAIRT